MNTQVLTKCLDELNKDKPNIEYIKGMLETFIALSGGSTVVSTHPIYETKTPIVRTETISDEEKAEQEALAKYHGGPIGKITS